MVPYRSYAVSRRAFTLVELSIVLVILGLIVGGFLAGQSLVRAAELRSVTTQYNGFQTALTAFKDKYSAIPGDMVNAQSYWGVAHATPATCITTASTTPATCNGNGSGVIDEAAAGSNEVFRFWQHLANAGLIEGQYNGITQGSTAYSATVANSPIGKLRNSLWFTYNFGAVSGSAYRFNGTYTNSFVFGGVILNGDPQGLIFKPEEVWNIDVKIDDGKPAQGKLKVNFAVITNCTDASGPSILTANYLLTNGSNACSLNFPEAY